MHKLRKSLSFAVVFAIAASFVALVAAPAHAAAGANVVFLNPRDNVDVGGGPHASKVLSSRDGVLADLTVAVFGGDDWYAARSVHFYVRAAIPAAPFSSNWFLLGTDTTPAMPDAAHFTPSFTSAFPRPTLAAGDENWKAFSLDVNTAALPGGITSAADFLAVVCGEGTTSFDVDATVLDRDAADNNPSFPIGLIPVTNCDAQAFTVGQALSSNVVISNSLAVVRGPEFPGTGYSGDAVTPDFTVTITATSDTSDVFVGFCPGVNPDTPTGGAIAAIEGGGGCPAFLDPAVEAVRAVQVGPNTWQISFSPFVASPGTALYSPALIGPNLVMVIAADAGFAPGIFEPALGTFDRHYFRIQNQQVHPQVTKLIWDYQNAPGNRTCQAGANAATSTIGAWALTDADGDGVEMLSTAPAPAAGMVDVDDHDNPVLKICTGGPSGFSVPLADLQVAWGVMSGPGDIDSDQPTYRDMDAALCIPGNPAILGILSCEVLGLVSVQSGGYYYLPGVNATGEPQAGGYARPGSVAEPPLIDPLGRATQRICQQRACQKADITDGINHIGGPFNMNSELGVDFAAVNSMTTGTTTYFGCVDKDGDQVCGANDGPMGTATMAWTPGGRNHNHLWEAGTAGADGHTGDSTVAAPAGSTVDLEGIFHDAGHNAVENAPGIWRIGPNSPGHFVSTESTTGTDGTAGATIGSSVLDAGRTTVVTFCGDGDSDGICDFTPAQVEINWGGVVTDTEIVSFEVVPSAGVFGTEFLAAGTLLDLGGNPVSSATLTIECRVLGDTNFVPVTTAVSDGSGDFGAPIEPTFSSDCRAIFPGNVSYTGSSSGTDRIWVRVGIALNASDTTVFAGDAVRLSGRVLPAHPGAVVSLQQFVPGRGWLNIASARLSASSTYAFVVMHSTSKSLIFRVTFPTQTLLNAWNVSRALRVTWA